MLEYFAMVLLHIRVAHVRNGTQTAQKLVDLVLEQRNDVILG